MRGRWVGTVQKHLTRNSERSEMRARPLGGVRGESGVFTAGGTLRHAAGTRRLHKRRRKKGERGGQGVSEARGASAAA